VGASGAIKVSIARYGNFTTEVTESTKVERKKTAGWEYCEAQDEVRLRRLKRKPRTICDRRWKLKTHPQKTRMGHPEEVSHLRRSFRGRVIRPALTGWARL